MSTLAQAVEHVLKIKAREGKTTKQDVTLMVHGRIEKLGGPTKFGIGAAAMRMALLHIIQVEVTRQMRQNLTEHEYRFVLPVDTPMEFIAALRKVPRWIALTEGVDAEWVPALQASPDNWRQNATLKRKKAHQTEIKADVSAEIARFLVKHKFGSLAEAMSKGV